MTDIQIDIGPPKRSDHNSKFIELWEALKLTVDAHPGEWCSVEAGSQSATHAGRLYFKKRGYEVVTRDVTSGHGRVYVRKGGE